MATENLLSRYVEQLLRGCGNTSCREVLCDTGRRNVSFSTTRRYTPTSARVIALVTAGGPEAESHLCEHMSASRNKENENADETADDATEPPIDTSAFIQLSSNTTTAKSAFSGSAESDIKPETIEAQRLYRSLEPLFITTRTILENPKIKPVSNADAAVIICNCFRWVHSTMPAEGGSNEQDTRYKSIQKNMIMDDAMHDGPKLRLVNRAFEAISARTALEDAAEKANTNMKAPPPICRTADFFKHQSSHRGQPERRRLLITILEKIGELTQEAYGPATWAAAVFWKTWNGSPVLERASPTCGALEYLESAYDLYTFQRGDKVFKTRDKSRPDIWDLPGLKGYIDVTDMASSWMNVTNKSSMRHLLSFPFLFADDDMRARMTYFRTINFLMMQKSHSNTHKAETLRRNIASNTRNLRPQGRLKYEEDHYLVVATSRRDILTDAYDQLWQRRRDELLRPLRVRLGESEMHEVGQDLGGIQIEFFNLICKKVFAEESNMFVSHPTNGLSFFRPMSLQPLYMFEMFGLLVALAIYNGIALPVSFPLTLYRELLQDNDPSNEAIFSCAKNYRLAKLTAITDFWQDRFSSLKEISQHALEVDWSFPLEANGLRLEVRPLSTYREGRRVLEVVNATLEAHGNQTTVVPAVVLSRSPVDIEAIAKAWPGWYLVSATTEPESTTAENMQQYLDEHIQWLTYDSVSPQLEAFKDGFFKVLDHRSISIFSPANLRQLVEGDLAVDIENLIRAAEYEGEYSARHPYIKRFWDIVRRWSGEKQMKLVKFVTAAERIPIGGPGRLKFVVAKGNPANPEDLPTSSTCFGVLSLPMYELPEILEEKLSLALEFGVEGFGVV